MTAGSLKPDSPSRGRKSRLIMTLITVDLLIAGSVPILTRVLHSYVYFASGAAVIAAWTFFAFWLILRDPLRPDPTTNSMRDAITAAFVVTYLVMVAWTAFFIARPSTEANALEPISQMLLTNFTVLTGIVVGFYFGADAAKQFAQIRQQSPPIGETTQVPLDVAETKH